MVTSYKGLVVYDLYILELKDLPAIIHDLIAFKQIADEPLKKNHKSLLKEQQSNLYCHRQKRLVYGLDVANVKKT